MRTSLLASALLAMLITIGAGCAASTDTQVDTSVDAGGGAAAGTQLEGTPPVNDTPDADINVEVAGDAGMKVEVEANAVMGETKTFTVTADNFAYDVKEMRVKKGDKVRVVFKNAEGFHDWMIDEFAGAKTAKHQAGGEETVEFIADKTGTFEYYCSVGSHRAMGMKGNLIVE